MTQSDMDIANQLISSTIPDITDALKALASSSGGPTAPPVTYPGQFWHDTTNSLLKVRSQSNSVWVTMGRFNPDFARFEFYADVFQALTAAGFSLKNSSGATVMSLSDTGILSGASVTISASKTLNVSAGNLALGDNQVQLNKVVAATTAGRGSVEKATTSEAEAGTAANKYPDVIGVKAAIAKQTISAPDAVFAFVLSTGIGSGQTFTASYATVLMNTVQRNVIAGVALTGNQITGLPAGDYYMEWEVVMRRSGGGTSTVQTQIYNVTGAVTAISGMSNLIGSYEASLVAGSGFYTLGAASTIDLRGFSSSGSGTSLGVPISSGISNEMAKLKIWKIG